MIPAPTSRADSLPRALVWWLPLILLLAPLPLGSNRPPFTIALALLAGGGLMLSGWVYARREQGWFSPWAALRLPMLCMLLVLGWGMVQIIPLPLSLAHPLWAQTAALLGAQAITPTLSQDATASAIGLLKLASYCALFALSYQLTRSTKLALLCLKTCALTAIALALYGLINYALGNAYVLWLPKTSYSDSLTGTFINRNAFAACLGMGWLALLGWLALYVQQQTPQRPLTLNLQANLLLLAAPLLLLALLLTNSRAGLLCAALGTAVLAFGLWRLQLLPRRYLRRASLAGLIAVVAGLAISLPQIQHRFDSATMVQDDRAQIWATTLQMMTQAPLTTQLTGQGLNTYDQLLAHARGPEIELRYIRAHNTYLELAVELGLPAALAFFTALAVIGARLFNGLRTRQHNQIYSLLALAVLIQAGTHALVDFSYQIPANAVWLAILLGMGCAQSLRSHAA